MTMSKKRLEMYQSSVGLEVNGYKIEEMYRDKKGSYLYWLKCLNCFDKLRFTCRHYFDGKNPKSCGCLPLGSTFGDWKILEIYPSGISRRFFCECVGCKEKRTFNKSQLRKNSDPCFNCGTYAELRQTALDRAVLFKFKEYIRGANDRDYSFNLNLEFFKKLITGECVYCSLKSNPIEVRNPKDTAYIVVGLIGVDRVDNNKGYELDNCVSCCKDCNRAKNAMGLLEFLMWMQRISENFESNIQIEEFMKKYIGDLK